MKAWKVVREKGDRYYSFHVRGAALIRYKPREKTYAPKWLGKMGYHPLVFKRKKDAQIYLDGFFNKYSCKVLILKAEVGSSKPLLPMLNNLPLQHKKKVFISQTWPKGTQMVEWVKILKGQN